MLGWKRDTYVTMIHGAYKYFTIINDFAIWEMHLKFFKMTKLIYLWYNSFHFKPEGVAMQFQTSDNRWKHFLEVDSCVIWNEPVTWRRHKRDKNF